MPHSNWIHGSAVGIEYPGRIYDGGPNTPRNNPRRAGWGTDVRQRSDTFNWFHFAIPTKGADFSSPDEYYTHRIWITYRARGVVTDSYHVWLGDTQIFRRDNLDFGPHDHLRWVTANFEVPRRLVGALKPINVSMRISFPSDVDEMGMVRLTGAGAFMQD